MYSTKGLEQPLAEVGIGHEVMGPKALRVCVHLYDKNIKEE